MTAFISARSGRMLCLAQVFFHQIKKAFAPIGFASFAVARAFVQSLRKRVLAKDVKTDGSSSKVAGFLLYMRERRFCDALVLKVRVDANAVQDTTVALDCPRGRFVFFVTFFVENVNYSYALCVLKFCLAYKKRARFYVIQKILAGRINFIPLKNSPPFHFGDRRLYKRANFV